MRQRLRLFCLWAKYASAGAYLRRRRKYGFWVALLRLSAIRATGRAATRGIATDDRPNCGVSVRKPLGTVLRRPQTIASESPEMQTLPFSAMPMACIRRTMARCVSAQPFSCLFPCRLEDLLDVRVHEQYFAVLIKWRPFSFSPEWLL